MPHQTRRTVLKVLGTAAITGGIASAAAGGTPPTKGRIEKLGHSLLSDPPGAYAEESIRNDGKFAVLGAFLGNGGSFLVDIQDPTNPTEVHHLPSPNVPTRHADVKFDNRNGLYYRTMEPTDVDGDGEPEGQTGVQVVDYGFGEGSMEDPQVIATLDTGPTHNVFPHPAEPVLYAVNEHNGTPALEFWNVNDPANPEKFSDVGPTGGLHDFVVDPDRQLGHGAFISDAFDDFDPDRDFAGYAVYDMSQPRNPKVVGRFDYTQAPNYGGEDDEENPEDVGNEGFERCHYADYDPERDIAVVSDEKGSGVPGGKHIFDVSDPANPRPVGFTLSPHAEFMGDDPLETFDWTTHNHDVIPKGDTTLLVSGDYHEGTVVYDISNPEDPVPTDRYRTDDDARLANDPIFQLGEAPMAWGADYSGQRDIVVTSDMFTGIYTFKVTPSTHGQGGGDGGGGGGGGGG